MKQANPNSFWLLSLLLILVVGSLGVWVVEDFSGPLSDGGDTDFYEYVGYFFANNLTLWPIPHLDLIHNQTFYPYGANHTLLDWGWERDYWYAIGYWLIGRGEPGPYLQYYYVYSLLVASLGTFWLLRTPFGNTKALVAGLIVSVFNFYCIWKYPAHLNVSVVHWTTLTMVATYRILYELTTINDRFPSPALWLVWVWLHIQVLSQELGYVAGFALTFTTICLPFMAWQLWRRHRPIRLHWEWSKRNIGLLAFIVISLWLYLPLTLQIFAGAQAYADAPVAMKPVWSHPIRLLIPYLPHFDSFIFYFQYPLGDWFESYGQGSPGLYLVILAGVGWWTARRQVALWMPVAVMLVLCLLYHPVWLPTLKLFPWFSFNRHGGRASMVYPVLFMLLALSVRWPQKRAGRVAFGALLLLMTIEWSWGSRYPLYYNPQPPSASVWNYMRVVRQTPGEAVLDFPFCTIGADGVGDAEGLCPYYQQQNAVFTFRRFHHKKVVGQYWGRLHPNDIQPFLRDRWPVLLQPKHKFTPADWQFLDQFLRQNRFAGINLYPDLLTAEQRQDFYNHFGTPIAQSQLPMAGRVEFLRLR